MGQKVNPNGLRVGINRDYSSHWYASKKEFSSCLKEDLDVRNYIEKKINSIEGGLSKVDIERIKNDITITIFTSRPGVVIGKDSVTINEIKQNLKKILKRDSKHINVNIVEIKNPDLDATLVAKDIAKQLQERASYRVVQKKAIQRVMRAGAKGCKTMTKGRIGGAEIARYEQYREGVLSLHTLSQPIDYACCTSHTTYGCIGVKVWISLPDNYKELRDRRPDDSRQKRQFNNNKKPNQQGNREKVDNQSTSQTTSKGE